MEENRQRQRLEELERLEREQLEYQFPEGWAELYRQKLAQMALKKTERPEDA